MGRYKSAQLYSDTATAKVQMDGLHAPVSGSGSTEADHRRNGPESSRAPPAPEKVEHVVGSTAGAASSEFHLYRASRRREFTRVEMMEKAAAAEEEAAQFALKISRNKKDAEERTKKNAEKRKKRKMHNRDKRNVARKSPDGSKVFNLEDFSDSEDEKKEVVSAAGRADENIALALRQTDVSTSVRLLLQTDVG